MAAARPYPREMAEDGGYAGGEEGMALGWRCLVSAVHPASGQLPCLARAARRVQAPRTGPGRHPSDRVVLAVFAIALGSDCARMSWLNEDPDVEITPVCRAAYFDEGIEFAPSPSGR